MAPVKCHPSVPQRGTLHTPGGTMVLCGDPGGRVGVPCPTKSPLTQRINPEKGGLREQASSSIYHSFDCPCFSSNFPREVYISQKNNGIHKRLNLVKGGLVEEASRSLCHQPFNCHHQSEAYLRKNHDTSWDLSCRKIVQCIYQSLTQRLNPEKGDLRDEASSCLCHPPFECSYPGNYFSSEVHISRKNDSPRNVDCRKPITKCLNPEKSDLNEKVSKYLCNPPFNCHPLFTRRAIYTSRKKYNQNVGCNRPIFNIWLSVILVLIWVVSWAGVVMACTAPDPCTCQPVRAAPRRGQRIPFPTFALTCRGKRLTVPPERTEFLSNFTITPANVIKLDLSNNLISELHHSTFQHYTALQTLILSENKIKNIAPDTFQNISLQVLKLDKNLISVLGEGALPATLKEVTLEYNAFTSFPPAIKTLTALHTLNLGSNKLKELKSSDVAGLTRLLILLLHQNRLSSIEEGTFTNLTRLDVLDLDGNRLKEIPKITQCRNLRHLLLSGNRVSYIPENTLNGLSRLEDVLFKSNPLRNVHHRAFTNLPSLTKLILNEVKWLDVFPDLNGTVSLETLRIDRAVITTVPHDLCTVATQLRTINLQRNQINHMPDLSRCHELRLIDLSHNKISDIPQGSFLGVPNLHDLLLEGNKITTIHNETFMGLHNLQVLQMEDNLISSIHPEAFMPLLSLEDINLGSNSFPELPSKGLEGAIAIKVHNNRNLKEFPPPESFPKVRSLTLSYAYHCCPFLSLSVSEDEPLYNEDVLFDIDDWENLDPAIWNMTDIWTETGTQSNFGIIWDNLAADFPSAAALTLQTSKDTTSTQTQRITCHPLPGPFMPCVDLFDWWALRCGVWVVFLLALLGNGTVVVVLFFASSKLDVPRFLVANLALADFFMGVYLGVLAVVDASTLGEFRMYAIPWQTSIGCQAAGFIGVLSSELSVYTLAVITLERNYAITHAMHLNKRLSIRHAVYIIIIGWIFASTLAILPLVGVSDYRKFAVCLPIETKGPGLAYVVFLMVINGVAFLTLMGCYLKIYCAIRGSQAWNTNDSRIAKRMALLVFTDFMCWAPVAFFSLTAAFGLHLISLEEAKVFTVFVLPFNSCCNPFLYALLTKQFKKDCAMLCKSIEESRVTRGIGRYRNSSNFSNRQTPANTNSALSNSWHKENQSRRCHNTQRPKLRHRLRISALKYIFCHRNSDELNSTGELLCQQGRHAVRKKHDTCASCETYSCSWSDSWRKGQSVMSLRLLDRGRNSGWYLTRKPSQESTLSSSRNDSSATTASTSTCRFSRSSVSSDVSSSGSRGLKGEARFGSMRDREIPPQPPGRQITVPHQLRQQPPTQTLAQVSPPQTSVRPKPTLQRQGAIERETYTPNKTNLLGDKPCPLHPRSDNLSCVFEQDSCEDEEPDKEYQSCPMTGLTVVIAPRKISSSSIKDSNVICESRGLMENESKENQNVVFDSAEYKDDIVFDSLCTNTYKSPSGGRCRSLTSLPQCPQASISHYLSEGQLSESRHKTQVPSNTIKIPTFVVSDDQSESEKEKQIREHFSVSDEKFIAGRPTSARGDQGQNVSMSLCHTPTYNLPSFPNASQSPPSTSTSVTPSTSLCHSSYTPLNPTSPKYLPTPTTSTSVTPSTSLCHSSYTPLNLPTPTTSTSVSPSQDCGKSSALISPSDFQNRETQFLDSDKKTTTESEYQESLALLNVRNNDDDDDDDDDDEGIVSGGKQLETRFPLRGTKSENHPLI